MEIWCERNSKRKCVKQHKAHTQTHTHRVHGAETTIIHSGCGLTHAHIFHKSYFSELPKLTLFLVVVGLVCLLCWTFPVFAVVKANTNELLPATTCSQSISVIEIRRIGKKTHRNENIISSHFQVLDKIGVVKRKQTARCHRLSEEEEINSLYQFSLTMPPHKQRVWSTPTTNKCKFLASDTPLDAKWFFPFGCITGCRKLAAQSHL